MPSHVCTVVAAEHRRWWMPAIAGLNESHIFVQPHDRGTAYEILFALLKLNMVNPRATVALLPADHYYRDEDTITRALRTAGNLAAVETNAAYLLGTDPTGPDSELGYILPAETIVGKSARLAGFTEKPCTQYARELLRLGALWSLFILVGSVSALLKLFEEDYAGAVAAMREALNCEATGGPRSLERFYNSIAPLDFSRDVLEVQATPLQVLRVPHCGWTDLETPKHVEATIRSLAVSAGSEA